MIAIEVRNVSKIYPASDSQWARLKQVFTPGAARFANGLWALRDVSFEVAKGETFGVVGANGSGKSTLLQIVAGILRPTSGTAQVQGRLSALLELGSGFAPEFTGRQNVYLNASILGLTKEEIDARFETIERFAEIGDFIDQPIRTYSTGMVLRLAFAVVAHVDPEVLIVDEALAVGDIAFRQRCMRRIHDLRAGGATILFVSHDASDVKALCERCLWLDHGGVRALGGADEVVAAYLSATVQRERLRDSADRVHDQTAAARPEGEALAGIEGTHRYGNGGASITGAEFRYASGEPVRGWTAGASIVLRMSFRVLAPIEDPIAGFLIRNEKGETIFGSNTARENCPLPAMAPGDAHTVDFHWTMPKLSAGRYFASLGVAEGTVEQFEICDYVEDAIALEAAAGERPVQGYMRIDCSAITVHR